MKIKLLLALSAAAALNAGAAPLTSNTPVHVRPDAASATVTVLKAGTEPKPAIGTALPLPSGWSAVEVQGPIEAYLASKDMLKSMDVRPGAAFYSEPKGAVVATMEPGDQVEITGYEGRWTQVKVTKKVVGYIQTGAGSGAVASTAAKSTPTPGGSSATSTARPAQPAPFSPAPAAPAAVASGGPGRPVQSVNLGDGGSASLPRLFQGKFVSTRSVLRPRRPYDFQLNDSAGQRYAYLDITRLLQTEQIEKYIDHTVTVYGTAKPVPNSKDIVIEVESLQLR